VLKYHLGIYKVEPAGAKRYFICRARYIEDRFLKPGRERGQFLSIYVVDGQVKTKLVGVFRRKEGIAAAANL
jgi:hypothetical protein